MAIIKRIMISVKPVGLAHPGTKPNICGLEVNNQSTGAKLLNSGDPGDGKLLIFRYKTGSGIKFEWMLIK